jgi:hypothetical protein
MTKQEEHKQSVKPARRVETVRRLVSMAHRRLDDPADSVEAYQRLFLMGLVVFVIIRVVLWFTD